MPKKHSPRRGSLGYRRKRAKSESPTVSNWPDAETPQLLGFPVYKCGMVTLYVEKRIRDRYREVFGKEATYAATVMEAPPIRILAVRVYRETPYGKKTFKEVWTPHFSTFEMKYLERKVNLPKSYTEEDTQKEINDLSGEVDGSDEVRVIARTMPELIGIGRKKPKLLEIGVGGAGKAAFEYGTTILGEKISVTDVFEKDELVDCIGVTKGEGFQGVVKRFGVRLLPPKTKKGIRKVAAMGAWRPARTSWRVPQAGQTGFHKRTDHNKQILEILGGDEVGDFNPSGGWKHYGLLRQPSVILKGSIQGTQKRVLSLRKAIRPNETEEVQLKSAWYSRELLKAF